jgi:hypothetical protein
MALALYESWRRAHLLRSQLSETTDNMLKPQVQEEENRITSATAIPGATTLCSAVSPNPSTSSAIAASTEELCLSNLNSWAAVGGGGTSDHTVTADVNSISFSTVYSEDQQYTRAKDQDLEAKKACSKDDALRRNWVVKFVNCQMLLKGSQTEGYVILR